MIDVVAFFPGRNFFMIDVVAESQQSRVFQN